MCKATIPHLLVAVLFLAGQATVANATQYTTAGAPPSELFFQIYLVGNLIGDFGTLDVTGTADADISLDGSGDGTLQFNGSDLTLESIADVLIDTSPYIPPLAPVFLGTILADLDGVGIDLSSSAINVTGNSWDIDADPPTAMDLSLDDGQILLHDATGIFAALLDNDPEILDLSADPVTAGIDDIFGFGVTGTATDLTISFNIPYVIVDIGEGLGLGADSLVIVVGGDIHLTEVPEPSTLVMLGVGLVGMVAVGGNRLRRHRPTFRRL